MTGEEEAVRRASRMASLYTPWVLRLAVTLRIPDLVAGGTAEFGPLSERRGIAPGGLGRLLRHLTVPRVLDRTGDGGFTLPDEGLFLLEFKVLDGSVDVR